MFHNVLKITHTPNFRFKSNHLIKVSLDIYLTYEKNTTRIFQVRFKCFCIGSFGFYK